MTNTGWGGAPGDQPTPPQFRCVRHPDRPTGLACSRCGRPACPDCLRSASVGQHCVDCIAEANKSRVRVRTVAGGTARTSPAVVTYTIMALNVLVFAFTAYQSRSIMNNASGSDLADQWALFPPQVANGQWFRLIGSGFVHLGLIHLLVNMFALYVIGRDLEMILGRSRYIAVYLVSLIGGSASVMVLETPLSATAGASGAIFGLLGAQAIVLLRLKRSPTPVLVVIGVNIIISVSIPGISLWGHMGGLVAGAAATAGLVFLPGRNRSSVPLGWLSVAAVAAVCLLIIALRVIDLRAQLGI